MGHLRLPVLPRTKKWQQVVEELKRGDGVAEIAGASAVAAEAALAKAAKDPGLGEALWLLTRIPLAARGPDYRDDLEALGLSLGKDPSLFELTAAVASTLDEKARHASIRTDLGEIAGLALIESLTAAVEPQLPSLFDPTSEDVRSALAHLAGGDRFARLARIFFARLTQRCLDYYLGRELANHVGRDRRFVDDGARASFDVALAQHCHEASRIVEDFAAGWYGKTVYQGTGLTRNAVEGFARYALKKLRDELGRRRDAA